MSSGLNEKLLQTGINFIKGPRGRSKDICETSFNHRERTNIVFFFFPNLQFEQLVFYVFFPALLASSLIQTITATNIVSLYDHLFTLQFVRIKVDIFLISISFHLVTMILMQVVHPGEYPFDIYIRFCPWMGTCQSHQSTSAFAWSCHWLLCSR